MPEPTALDRVLEQHRVIYAQGVEVASRLGLVTLDHFEGRSIMSGASVSRGMVATFRLGLSERARTAGRA